MRATHVLIALALAAPRPVLAQSCPQVSSNTPFAGTEFQTACSTAVTQGCTSPSGVTYNSSSGLLTLPTNAGQFQSPPNAAVTANVYFAAPADYDRDGWTDFVAANDSDGIYVMRNQTITCSTTGCTGSSSVAPTAQTIAASWWNTITNKRSAAFRQTTNTSATALFLKPAITGTQRMSPMGAGDFDGDGWADFVQISATYQASPGTADVVSWPNAARLFMNTKNCRLTTATTNPTPCGIGTLCSGQPTNGACTGTGLTNGTVRTETQLSCTTTSNCPYYMPTFATYDLLTGAAISSTVTTTSTPTSGSASIRPGMFGPIGHPSQNIVVLDWDGDGDLDFLYGHSGGTCPGTLCGSTTPTFYPGIDVWKNDCAQSAQWVASTKSCIGHIPVFSRTQTVCTGSSCNNGDVLIPSTAHNTTTLAPTAGLGFDVTTPSGDKRVPAFAYSDIDNDGDLDLVVGSPGCCSSAYQNRLRVFRGTTNSPYTHTLDTANPIILSTNSGTTTWQGFQGSLTAVFVTDFSGDGWPDIVTGSDAYAYSGTIGGRTRYWKNSGNAASPFGTAWPTCSTAPATCTGCSASCNPAATTVVSESCGSSACTTNLTASPPTFPDFDMGLMLDYDHDPQNTKDMVFTNGNTSNEFYIFPNRATAATVAPCGTISSGQLPPPADESTVTGACLTPTATLPNATSSITYYLSNETPSNFIQACKQTSSGFTPATCCVSFTNVTGKTITWKAVFDSNSADDATSNSCTLTGSASPTVSNISANYTYNNAVQQYRAGVVVSDGVSYVGSFRQPGNRGSFYALAAGTGAKYYDAAAKLDVQSTRNLYTTSNVGTGLARISFSPTSPSSALIARVGASTATEATNTINWVLSARFGLGTTMSKLGAVMDSTPAILTPPFRPAWYAYLSSSERAVYDNFASANSSRVPLALFASMDGFIHAVISNATQISDSRNGTEAWGFVPPYVAASMKSNFTTGTVTSYPDGSVTLFDYRKANGTIATVALVPDGAGGSSLTALDVTSTITPVTYSVSGPTPMWSVLPGDALAGKAMSKPGIARVSLSGNETFVVVAGTGINSADASKGKVVAGYNLETGALLWKFEMACALTSDITVVETDDVGELGPPTLDGFTDRAVFADACGYVYKIDPGQNLAGAYMANTGLGTIALGTSNGVARFALFSTQTTSGALGQQRPIVGAIAAKVDATTDMILYFGTGGLSSVSAASINELYAVRLKDGTIRNKVTGTCPTAGHCEKFYGGVVISPDSVIVTRSVDPDVGNPSACDYGSSRVQFLDSNTFTQTALLSSVAGSTIAATAGPLFGDAGALYFATVSGEIKRIGSPRAATAGADSAAGQTQQSSSTTQDGDTAGPMALIGWRVVL